MLCYRQTTARSYDFGITTTRPQTALCHYNYLISFQSSVFSAMTCNVLAASYLRLIKRVNCVTEKRSNTGKSCKLLIGVRVAPRIPTWLRLPDPGSGIVRGACERSIVAGVFLMSQNNMWKSFCGLLNLRHLTERPIWLCADSFRRVLGLIPAAPCTNLEPGAGELSLA